jgi:hypothetical protein
VAWCPSPWVLAPPSTGSGDSSVMVGPALCCPDWLDDGLRGAKKMYENLLSKESKDLIKKFITGSVTLEQVEKYTAELEYSEFIRFNSAILLAIFLAKKIMKQTDH